MQVTVNNITTQVEVQAGYDLYEIHVEDYNAESAKNSAIAAAISASNALSSANDAADSAAAALASENAAEADALATAADRVQTGLDRVATGQDRTATEADALATASDRVQTGLDRVATGADRVQTGTDAGVATTQAGIATTQAGIATTQAGIATTQAGIATTQATNSLNSANAASTSATNALNSANAASTSATNALNSANAAAASAASAAQVGTSTLLTGFSVGANTAIAGTDSILQAFNKTQGQINATNSLIYGLGNLREWFGRQFNCHTNSTVANANKRVSMMHFGDSLTGRLTGWFNYYASFQYSQSGRAGRFGNLLGPIFLSPTGPNANGGVNNILAGDAVAVTNGFSIWPNGLYTDLGPSGTIIFPNATGFTVDLWRIPYVAEPSAATFVIEIASVTGGPWTQLGAEVNAANATQIGAVAERTTGTNARRFVRVRNTSASARVKIIDPYAGFANNIQGFDGGGLSQGGISPSQAAQALAAIYTPILTAFNPALICYHFDDSLANIESAWAANLAMMRAGNPTRSILVIVNGPRTATTTEQSLAIANFFKSRVATDNIAVLDMMSLLSSMTELTAQGWQGDGIHVDQIAYAYCAQRAWNELNIGSNLGILFREEGLFPNRVTTGEIRFQLNNSPNVQNTGVWDDYYCRFLGDNSFLQGGGFQVHRDFYIGNKGATVIPFQLDLGGENTFGNRFPPRFHRANLASEGIPAGYNTLTTGVLEWSFNDRRVFRNQATGQILRAGPFTGEAALDFPEIAAGSEATLTVTVTGVTVAGRFAVQIGWSSQLEDGLILKQAWVSGNNTVSVRLRNVTASPINPVSITCYIVAMAVI